MTPEKPSEPRFDDGSDARSDFRDRQSSRGAPRKTLQLCSQIRRAIELVLMSEVDDELLEDVGVEDVVPTADPSRLLVMFVARGRAADTAKNEVLAHLEGARNKMVQEVVRSIHRRKVPDLAFEVIKGAEAD